MTVCTNSVSHVFNREKSMSDLAKKYMRLRAIEKMRSKLLGEIEKLQEGLEESE